MTILVDVGVVDDCLRHCFGTPGKIEGCCVGRFPSPLSFSRESRFYEIHWFIFFQFARCLRSAALTIREYGVPSQFP